MRLVFCFIFSTFFLFLNFAAGQTMPENKILAMDAKPVAKFISTSILEPMRLTLRHEISYKVKGPGGIKNHRSSLRFEYKKSFFKYFYVQADSKLNAFWIKDHRSEAHNEKLLFQNNVLEGFLQFSMKQTSLKVGIQKMIWGESEAGAVTDVISPRDYSEIFFISLEESRRGQPIISVDQFTKMGDFTFFFVPLPLFNRYPYAGSAYYYDPFAGHALVKDEKTKKK